MVQLLLFVPYLCRFTLQAPGLDFRRLQHQQARAEGPSWTQLTDGRTDSVSSLTVKTESVTSVPYLSSTSASLGKSSSAPLLQQSLTSQVRTEGVSRLPSGFELKSEAVTTAGSMTTVGSTQQRSDNSALPSYGGGSSLTVQTLGKVNVAGSGSAVAVPTAYTTAVTTVATSTTYSSLQDVLGKRVRRVSSKYEDHEQVGVCGN